MEKGPTVKLKHSWLSIHIPIKITTIFLIIRDDMNNDKRE